MANGGIIGPVKRNVFGEKQVLSTTKTAVKQVAAGGGATQPGTRLVKQ